MPLTITDAPSEELLSVGDAKQHLRYFSDDADGEIESVIRAARDYCERWTQRTLRTAVARVLTQNCWWSGYCSSASYSPCSSDRRQGLWLPWPPLLSNPAPEVTYYDADNVLQTLDSDQYIVEYSTDGGGRLVWAQNATIPALYFRPDAVNVAFSTGYADVTALPPVALQAMKMKISELWGAGTENETKAAKMATDNLLGLIDWSGYA